jgi:hypothetical protein
VTLTLFIIIYHNIIIILLYLYYIIYIIFKYNIYNIKNLDKPLRHGKAKIKMSCQQACYSIYKMLMSHSHTVTRSR